MHARRQDAQVSVSNRQSERERERDETSQRQRDARGEAIHNKNITHTHGDPREERGWEGTKKVPACHHAAFQLVLFSSAAGAPS
jgi:hypothetical protein